MRIQDFDFNIEYRAGCKTGHVDYLSRNWQINVLIQIRCANSIAEYQAQDDFCQSLVTTPQENFVIQAGIVYHTEMKKGKQNFKCFVSIAAKRIVMKAYHEDVAHKM